MLEQNPGVPKSGQPLLPGRSPNTLRQQQLMLAALLLLLVALTAVLYRDRDFWFPDTETDDRLLSPPEAQDSLANVAASTENVAPESQKRRSHRSTRLESKNPQSAAILLSVTLP